MTNPHNTPPPPGLTAGVVSNKDVVRKESADDYSFVLLQFFADTLNPLQARQQWIVQFRSAKKPNVGVWIGKKHVTSKSALLVVCSTLHLIRDQSIAQKVLQLPDFAEQTEKK